MNYKFARAAIVLPTILLIGGIIVEIGLAGVFIAYFFSQSGLGVKLSEEALAAAQAGVQDAILKIVRDKNFGSSSYSLTVANRSADVTVCKDTCAGSGKYQITSLGKALTKRRQVQAIVGVTSSGETKIESIKEIAL
ncbi:MAG: hypothetical protein UT92_C0001G0006 [Candidatus Curtissbacteria bacterium GW2011_GWA1_40_24]|uniref:Uncharacterized protein n=2 Tax=Patescibacteria group TaxID=1783273 RepID=A0A0G0RT19_9BACT|nr:MAG: hypothetical protein UT92_C0001G0006 [Candidatus Curtissbacteria bacterium GW2011_GWA1_40_24]KKR89003.1 MAG: hypothetical protein UU38_C0002G0006 [Candidatus Wolfebacteria bacterium GW2011_GWB1_41_12]